MNKKFIIKIMICLSVIGAIGSHYVEKVSAENKSIVYTVKQGDCLDSIALHYINTIYCVDKNVAVYKLRTRIQVANGMQGTEIKPGQQIVIPRGIGNEN